MKQVLIVEDHADTRAIYANCSTDAIHLTTVASGETALEMIDENEFDAVLLDLSMHPLDGLQVAQEIRRNEETHTNKKRVHLAFFTARLIDETVQEVAAETDVEMIFQKPCDPFVLVEQVESWLDNTDYIQGKRGVRIQEKEKGKAHTALIVAFIGAVALILTASYFQYQLAAQKERFDSAIHAEEEKWAKDWSLMKSERDRFKTNCDDVLKGKDSLEIFIQQKGLQAPPELLAEKGCN